MHLPTYFYHSFPRQKDHALGLRILTSILENGLLLTAELRTFPGYNALADDEFIQIRACFTALTPDRLADHADGFGSFSLEFDVASLREFGALPAVYFSGRLPNGEMFNSAGDMLARTLLETHNVLGRLWHLRDNGDDAEKALAEAILQKIHPAKITVQELHFTLQALLNLYYPTDDPSRTDPLHYYRQNEWKIVPNLAFNQTWHYDDLSDTQKSEILKINPAFFGALLRGQRRIDYCRLFASVGGNNIIDSARRILVPDEVIDDAQKIVAARRPHLTVVPMSKAVQ